MINDVLNEIIRLINECDKRIGNSPNITEQTLLYATTLNLIAGLAKGGLLMERNK